MFKCRLLLGGALSALLLVGACGDDGDNNNNSPDAGIDADAMEAGATMFTVRVENLSGSTALPGPIAPGVWSLHAAGPTTLFTAGETASPGLEALAEDGSPGALHDELTGGLGKGVFNTPTGANMPAPIFPGDAYEFVVEASVGDNPSLDLAAMLVQTNDVYLSLGDIALFDSAGMPVSGDFTSSVTLWESGTEQDQAPGSGPDQAPRQAAPNTGAAEGKIRRFSDSTRAMPGADALVAVSATESGGVFTITVENVSGDSGLAVTPMAPVFWSIHNDSWSFFTPGSPDLNKGLETLAEDGSPADLVAGYAGDSNATVGAMAMPTGGSDPGPLMPGQDYTFDVTPTSGQRFFSFASMAVQTNDGFVATSPGGVALLEMDGTPRAAADVSADLQTAIALWDAGTETNQVPGAGFSQPIRGGGDTGAVDANTNVRLYGDATNDLENANDYLQVDVVAGSTVGSLAITLTNVGGTMPYGSVFAPANYILHNDSIMYFGDGGGASPGLEALAEDGNPGMMKAGQAGRDGVVLSENAAIPDGSAAAGPIMPGSSYSFEVTPAAANSRLSFGLMLANSNDTFFSLDPAGIDLMAGGILKTPAMVQTELRASLSAWDAGTESNQAGAAGADIAPGQSAPNTGAPEGDGTVHMLASPWPVPAIERLVKITITPM